MNLSDVIPSIVIEVPPNIDLQQGYGVWTIEDERVVCWSHSDGQTDR